MSLLCPWNRSFHPQRDLTTDNGIGPATLSEGLDLVLPEEAQMASPGALGMQGTVPTLGLPHPPLFALHPSLDSSPCRPLKVRYKDDPRGGALLCKRSSGVSNLHKQKPGKKGGNAYEGHNVGGASSWIRVNLPIRAH